MTMLWAVLPFVALALAIPIAVWWERGERARQYVTVEITADLTTYADALDELRRAFDDLKVTVGLSFLHAMSKLAQALSTPDDRETER